MNLVNNENISIRISKKPKGSKFRRKPYWEAFKSCYWSVENGKDFKYVNCKSHYMPKVNRCFWMWWIIVVEIKPKLISGETPNKYVRFEDTHLQLMDLPEGSWKD